MLRQEKRQFTARSTTNVKLYFIQSKHFLRVIELTDILKKYFYRCMELKKNWQNGKVKQLQAIIEGQFKMCSSNSDKFY